MTVRTQAKHQLPIRLYKQNQIIAVPSQTNSFPMSLSSQSLTSLLTHIKRESDREHVTFVGWVGATCFIRGRTARPG